MKQKMFVGILLVSLFWMTGCEMFGEQALPAPAKDTGTQAKAPMVVGQTNQSLERRFGQDNPDQMDAVKAAVMWSEKYQQVSLQTEQLREKNMQLVLENERLKQDIIKLGSELQKTQTELAGANELLGQFQQELTRWKSDVLGFRDEIRSAQTAQLTALSKILRLLGAETVQETQPPAAAATPEAQPSQGETK